MIDESSYMEHLKAWKNDCLVQNDQHLDDAKLYRLSADKALASADKEAMAHLSRCPVCIGNWADWKRARTVTSGNDTTTPEIGFAVGFLQAAAAQSFTESLSMQSQCGSYRLDILPQDDDNNGALVVFEATTTAENQQARITIRDRTGLILLEGALQEGRLARTIADPDQYDLSTWTVLISPDPGKDS